jgi:hypothetical protein
MKRLIGLAVGLVVLFLGGSCATMGGPVLPVPDTVTVDKWVFDSNDPGFLFIRFLNQGDIPNGSSTAVLVLVAYGKPKILSVVGPLSSETDYTTFFQKLRAGSGPYAPGAYFCPAGRDCHYPPAKPWPDRPKQSPGPPPPEPGSITTMANASASITNDANAAAAAAVNTVNAAQH